MDSLTCPLAVQASKHPESVAIEQGTQQLSYLQLDGLVNSALKEMHKQGVRAGQIVCTVANNSVELIVLAIACWRAGIIWAPFNPRVLMVATERQLLRLKPHWLWSPCKHFGHCYAILHLPPVKQLMNQAEAGLAAESPDPELPIDLLQTSGTSGNAKLVAHNLRNHLLSARASSELIPVAKEDAWLLSLPLHHIAGVAILYRCFEATATVVLTDGDQHWLEPVRKGRVTHLSLVNTQLFDLLATEQHVATQLKAILLGGGPISPDLLVQARHRGLHCYSSYGMTEASSQIYTVDHEPKEPHEPCGHSPQQANNSPQAPVDSMPSPGHFLPCVEARLDDQQQILIRGGSVALGYWQNGKVCNFLDDNGWFATGDTGQLDGGRLSISGRRDNVFVCHGENLQPEQIERALSRHPSVGRVLVVAVDELRSGKVPVAFVDWNQSPDEHFEKWLTMNIDGLQRPRVFLPWHYVVAKNNKFDRKASALVAQRLFSQL